jgi:Alpha-2-macroglobulin family/Bacterial Alpha-2-macroglobulin MG10 domain/MG2 domain/Carboxypeptidase regulatory-like domain
MKVTHYLLLLIVLLTCSNASGQKLTDFISQDTMVYVYTLDNEQATYLLKKNTIEDTSFLFTHLYKTYPVKTYNDDSLPNGNFIVTSIVREMINYRYVYKSSFQVKSKVIDHDVILFINDKKNKANIEQAKVEIDGVAVVFNEGYGGYSFDQSKINKDRLRNNQVFIAITLGNEYTLMRYNFNEGYRPPPESSTTPQTSGVSEGYIITDKPLYKPGDTLNLKAFLMDPKNGRPIRRKTRLTITEPMQNFSFSKKIKRSTPGAYLFKWQIPDSLKIDRTFNLTFQYNKRSIPFFHTGHFYLEDYVLNTSRYDVTMLSELYYAGEDITFYAVATDANQFPIQGTQIHYKLSINQVTDFLSDSLTLTEAKRLNWYEKDTVYPYENFMELKIPSSILPNINANYNLEVSFTDPNTFERKVFVKQFTKQTEKEKELVYQREDSVHIRCLYNLKDVERPYTVISLSNNDTLFSKKISTPYSFKLSPYTTRVIFIDKDSFSTNVDIRFNKLDITHIIGKRSADSIRIAFNFPFDEAVYYRILKGNKLIKAAKSSRLDFSMKDESKDAYTILFTTNLNNNIENNFYKITYVPNVHQIKLTSTIPPQAYPGQKLPITITATDYKSNPLSKVNIAAFAANKQFEERLTTPQILIPEQYKDLIDIHEQGSIDNISLSIPTLLRSYIINKRHLATYQLQKNEYYELRYPRKQMAIISKDIQSNIPEFAVTVTHKNILYTPKYILLDGQPVYLCDLNSTAYSFQSNIGNHSISFRYFNKLYVVNDIHFDAGKKYWLGINIDSVTKSNGTITITDSLPTAQPNAEEKKLLYASLLFTNQFAFDTLNVRIKKDSTATCYYTPSTRPNVLNVDGDAFYVFGPLTSQTNAVLQLKNKAHTLIISPEYAHYYDAFTKEFTTKNIGPIKGVIFNFYENQLQDYQLASLLKPDIVKPLAQAVDMKFDKEALKAAKEEPEVVYAQNYRLQNTGNYFQIKIKNMQKNCIVKALWVINNTKAEECVFSTDIPQNNVYGFPVYASDGIYDLYFLLSNKKLLIMKNISLKNHDEFYVNPALFKSEKISNERLAIPLKIYSDLTKLPLLPFYFPPEESAEAITNVKNPARSNPYLHGIITDKSLQAITNAIILLEVNGKFKEGAYTNSNGEFEVLNLAPGSYQIKVFHPEYQMLQFPVTFMQQGYDYALNVGMNEAETQKPVLETINQDFRLMCFKNKAVHDVFKIRLYDRDTREPLQQVSISISKGSKNVTEISLVDKHEIDIPFPSLQDTCTIIFTKEGYQPIVLHGIRFNKGMYYTLHIFMMLNDARRPQTNKEYNVNIRDLTDDMNAYRGSVYNQQMNREERERNVSVPMYASAPESRATSMNYTSRNVSGAATFEVLNDASTSTYAWSNLEVLDEAVSIKQNKNKTRYADDNMINDVVNNTDISQSRKKFNDVGFWEPNHITDKQGKTSFDIRLPDNITTWKSTIIAMGKHRLHGIDSTETKVFKPLQSMSIIPSFIWDNDKVYAKAKFTNLTKDAKKVTVGISLNDKIMSSKEVSIKNEYVDSILLSADNLNAIHWKAGLQFEKTYKDDEERDIQVFSSAFKLYTNQHVMMEKDSTYTLQFANGIKGKILLNNTLYEKIIAEINELNNYEYGCVEQTTSKLKALLCKEKINKTMGLKENLTPSIYNLINRLSNYQNTDGTWGWWKRESVNWRMTIYAMDVLRSADIAGYSNSNYNAARNVISANFYALSTSDQLYAMYVFQKTNVIDNEMKTAFSKININELKTSDKIYYYKVAELIGRNVKASDLYALALEMNNRMQTPYYEDFFHDPKAAMFTAYFIFANSSIGDEWLNVFKDKLSNGQLEKNLNTYAKANMIEALTSSFEYTGNKPITAQVTINDTLQINTFPYSLPITGTSYNLKHTGGNVFVNTAEEYVVYNPKKSDSLFSVTTSFIQQQQSKDILQAGIPCQMKITVNAYRSSDYVMLEIPIPAGMRVINKIQPEGCRIEYFNHKMVVFYSKLSMDQHQLVIDMQPILKGSFTLPAAKCSLMYYPYIFGNNEKRTIEIR